jgi:hypothetical protein
LLSDFRGDHGSALDALFTQVIASLVDKDVVRVSRISQDGVRVVRRKLAMWNAIPPSAQESVAS